jgi:hypothetical protein
MLSENVALVCETLRTFSWPENSLWLTVYVDGQFINSLLLLLLLLLCHLQIGFTQLQWALFFALSSI